MYKSSQLFHSSRSPNFRVLMKSRRNHQKIIEKQKILTEQNQDQQHQKKNNITIFRQSDSIKRYIKQMKNQRQQSNLQQSSSKRQQVLQLKQQDHQLLKEKFSNKNHTQVLQRSQSQTEKKQQLTKGLIPQKIEVLEERLEKLIEFKISKFSKSKRFPQFKPSQQYHQINQQINKIVISIQQMKGQDINQQQVQDISRKILILQKIIAQSNTQSEIIRKFYYQYKTQKKNQQTLINSKNQILYKSTHILQQLAHSLSFNKQKPNSFISIESTSSLSYKKPAKDQYVTFKYQRPKYIPNRQPLPRSTYNCENLNYGILPNYRHKQQGIMLNITNRVIGQSTYKRDFKQTVKQPNRYNYKELDCFKDKFRNPNLSFLKSFEKAKYNASENVSKQNKKIIKNQIAKAGKDKTILNQSEVQVKLMTRSAISETKRQFGTEKLALLNINLNKNKNIVQFKNAYKAYFNMLK